MNKNRVNSLFGALIIMIIIGGFTSCNDSLDPIFYTLEHERPIADDSLDNEITVHNVVKGGTWYFAAAPTIYYRATGSTDWKAANMPQFGSGVVMCGTMEISNGGDLFAGFFSVDGETFGLYRAAVASFPNLSWTRVSYGALASTSEQIVMVKNVNSVLLVGTKNGETYLLHDFDEATTVTTHLSSLDGMPTDALWDTTNYWVVAGSKVYQATTLAGLGTPLTTAPSLSTGASFGGICAAFSRHYLSNTDGKIWYSDDIGLTWTSSADKSEVFTKFIEVGGNLLVGTRYHGYYKIAGGSVDDMERQPHYSISDLYNGAVLNFALDGTTKLFTCTAGAGLWRSDDSGENWNRE
ncbi:hypothetical protein ES705_41510 [subsurface metagenome]